MMHLQFSSLYLLLLLYYNYGITSKLYSMWVHIFRLLIPFVSLILSAILPRVSYMLYAMKWNKKYSSPSLFWSGYGRFYSDDNSFL